MTETRLLLRNGHVIDTERETVAHPRTDVLIEGDMTGQGHTSSATPTATR